MTKEIAQQWLRDSAETANERNYKAHMDLISKRVNVTGISGFDNIGYDDWAAQCKHEFDNNILKQVSYDGLILLAETDTRLMFKTHETVEANDGTVNAQSIEVLLEKEDDGIWRVVQERVLPEDEAKRDKLI